MKKLASLFLALVMILGCMSIASAEIDPELIAVGYSVCFVRDAADYMENYQ